MDPSDEAGMKNNNSKVQFSLKWMEFNGDSLVFMEQGFTSFEELKKFAEGTLQHRPEFQGIRYVEKVG